MDSRCLSHACCTVGCPKHDGAVALNLNIRHEGREERSHGEAGCSVVLLHEYTEVRVDTSLLSTIVC